VVAPEDTGVELLALPNCGMAPKTGGATTGEEGGVESERVGAECEEDEEGDDEGRLCWLVNASGETWQDEHS